MAWPAGPFPTSWARPCTRRAARSPTVALFDRAAALVRGQVQRQSPQLEAAVGDDLQRPFLGGAIRRGPHYFVASDQGGRWSIDAGRVHGIPSPTPDDAVALALFAYETRDEDLAQPEKALAKARVSKVLGATSQIEIAEAVAGRASGPLKAVITHFPAPRLRVSLEGDAPGVEMARRAVTASLFVCEPGVGEAADFRLTARDDQYLIAKPDDDRPLVGRIDGYTDASAQRAVERLEHIERWKTTAELDNPATSIGEDELLVEILQHGRPLTGSEIRLEYTRGAGDEWSRPEIAIRLKNAGAGPSTSVCWICRRPSVSSRSSAMWAASGWTRVRRRSPTAASRSNARCRMSCGSEASPS